MALFDKLAKKVTRGMSRTAFEADKLRRATEIKAKISSLRKEMAGLHAAVAGRVIELCREGTLELPELDDEIQAVLALESQIEEKDEELRAAQAEEFQTEGETIEEGVCPQCHAELAEGAIFCPNCGAKVG